MRRPSGSREHARGETSTAVGGERVRGRLEHCWPGADLHAVCGVWVARSRAPWSALAEDARRESSSADGPASDFRDAATDGVGVWGPILGGVVAVGGGLAIVGTLLKDDPDFEPNLACPSMVADDSCAPTHALMVHA